MTTTPTTAYALSKELNANYRTITKLLDSFADKGLIDTHIKDVNNKPVKNYFITEEIKAEITTRLQQGNTTSATVRNTHSEQLLTQLKDLQLQQVQQQETITNLNDLITNKDKALQDLTNKNTILDADLRIAKSELKLITDKSDTIQKSYFEEKTAKEQLQQELKQKNLLITGMSIALALIIGILATLLIIRNF